MTTQPLTVGNVAIRASGGEAKHQPALFVRLDTTQALIQELCSTDSQIKPVDTVRGRGKPQGTYACRELVIAYAAWISAAFQLKVIKVFLNTAAPASAPTPAASRLPAEDPARTEKAYALAQQTASMVADKVFKAAVAGRYNFSDGRWWILVSRCGTQVSCIDPNAAVLTPAQFIEGIRTGDVGALWTSNDLMQLAQVTLDRLKYQLNRPVPSKSKGTNPVRLSPPPEGHQTS